MPFAYRRITVRALLPLLLLVALGGAGQGQTPQQPEPEAPPAGRETLGKTAVFRALGQEIRGASGIVVAQLVNVLVEPDGTLRAAVLDYGGFLGVGKRRIAVAWSTLQFTEKGVILTLTRDQLKAFPEYREGEDIVVATAPPNPAAEKGLPGEDDGRPQAAKPPVEASPAQPEPEPPVPPAEPAPERATPATGQPG